MATRLKDEILQISILYLAIIGIFKLLFFNEDIIVVLKVVSGFYFVFLIPGFAMMYYWNEKLDFLERLIIGTVLGMAVFGIISYYTGLMGFNLKYQSYVLPVLFTVLAVGFNYFLSKRRH